MKTIFNQSINKFFILFIFTSVLFVSCKKDEEIEPSVADQVAGSYEVSSLSQGGQTVNLPANGVTGEYTIAKMTDDKVNVKFSIKNNGKVEEAGEENADLKKASDGSIEFYLSNAKVGTFKNKTITFIFDDGSGDITIVANKK